MNNKKLFLSLIYSSMALLILVSLGTWQLERLRWKTDILSSMKESLSLPPLKITGQVIDNIDQYSFRRIQLTGNYLYKDNITIYSKVFNKKVGKHLIVPLETQYGIILVNRGFIPSDFNIENNMQAQVAQSLQEKYKVEKTNNSIDLGLPKETIESKEDLILLPVNKTSSIKITF